MSKMRTVKMVFPTPCGIHISEDTSIPDTLQVHDAQYCFKGCPACIAMIKDKLLKAKSIREAASYDLAGLDAHVRYWYRRRFERFLEKELARKLTTGE